MLAENAAQLVTIIHNIVCPLDLKLVLQRSKEADQLFVNTVTDIESKRWDYIIGDEIKSKPQSTLGRQPFPVYPSHTIFLGSSTYTEHSFGILLQAFVFRHCAVKLVIEKIGSFFHYSMNIASP